jgi:hypothetical protein
MDIKRLQEKTKAAIEAAKLKHAAAVQKEIAKQKREEAAINAKAEYVTSQIPHRAEVEAEAGRSHAIVYSIPFGEWMKLPGTGPHADPDPAQLQGVAKKVYGWCVEAGMKPSIEFWHDGQGMASGHNIVIHW